MRPIVHLVKATHIRKPRPVPIPDFGEWNRLLPVQEGTCGICSRPPEVIDRDPLSAIVRGLLCARCQEVCLLLGWDVDLVRELLRYMVAPPALKLLEQ